MRANPPPLRSCIAMPRASIFVHLKDDGLTIHRLGAKVIVQVGLMSSSCPATPRHAAAADAKMSNLPRSQSLPNSEDKRSQRQSQSKTKASEEAAEMVQDINVIQDQLSKESHSVSLPKQLLTHHTVVKVSSHRGALVIWTFHSAPVLQEASAWPVLPVRGSLGVF